MNILLIEDNPTIIKGLKYSFDKTDYNLICITSFKESIEYLSKNTKVDLIILDVTLPDGNGFILFDRVIKNTNIPTIFLTAKDEEDDIVKGLELGAEDYITKPFSAKELIARINKVLARTKKNSVKQIKNIKFDMNKMIVYRDDNIVDLTSLELKLLHLLFLDVGKVINRNSILDEIWTWTGNYVDDHTVTVYFNRIRDKLKTDIIVTVKGIGYRIDDEE